MAFPTVPNTTSGVNAAGTTSHTFNLAAGTVASNGLLICGEFSSNISGTWPAGWTSVVAKSFAGSSVRLECYYRIADGGEAGSITVTSLASASVYRSYRIAGVHASSIAEGTIGDGNGAMAANPPAHTASWGAEDNLWVVPTGHQAETSITYPASHADYATNGLNQNHGTVFLGIASTWRTNAAASEDPTAYAFGSSNHSVVATIAVRPAATVVLNAASAGIFRLPKRRWG
jgi:hypothetical protein